MSTGYSDPLFDEFAMRRGLSGGAREPVQRIDFNFSDAGIGGAFSNPLVPMLLQPAINSMFGGGGFMPAQFAPQQGLWDQYRAKSYGQARQAAMATASSADRETYVAMIRGIAQMQGTPWGLEQQRSANVMAQDVAYMAPLMAQANPELFDLAHGTRGSATVMASFFHKAGIMGVDPATGRTGVSGASSGILAAEMHRRFFGQDADLAGWRGLSAGRAGALYDELQTRGLAGMSIGAMTPAEQTAALTGSMTSRQDAVRLLQAKDPGKWASLGTGPAGVGGADVTAAIEGLRTSNPVQNEAMLRQFDANRIGNSLKSMSGAVAAMREIFGDAGRPNAPMSQLIEGLNALTQGGMATMNPAELERTVRTTQVIARTSGLGMNALQGLTAQGGVMAQQMGLDRRFGITAAQGAAEFGTAYAQVGQGNLGGWGRVDLDQMRLLDHQLRLQASASPMANRLGAAMRLFETMKQDNVPIRGPLAAVAEAVQNGQATFLNERGQQETLNMSEGRWRRVMELSNVSGANANAFLRSQAANQEQVDRYGITDIVRRRQPDEIREMMAQHFHEAAVGQLGTVGITGQRARKIAEVAARAQAQAMTDMSVETRKDDATRNQALMDATRAAVMATGMSAGEFERLFPRGQLATMVAGGVGGIQQRIASDPAWKYPSMNTMLDLNNQDVVKRQAFLKQERIADVAMGTALSGLATAGPIARLMDSIQNPAETFGDEIKKVLGGVDPSKVREQLAAIDPNDLEGGVGSKQRLAVIMEEIMATTKKYEESRSSNKLTPAQKLAWSKVYEKRISALMAGSSKTAPLLRQTLLKARLIRAGATTSEVTAAAQKVVAKGSTASRDLQRSVGAYLGAGAAADKESILRQQKQVLAVRGITTAKDIDAALAGRMDAKLTDIDKLKLKSLAALAGGMHAQMAGEDISAGAQIGAKELEDVSAQQDFLNTDLEKDLPAEGTPERAEALAERRRHAGAWLSRGRRRLDLLLGDDASMRNLGKGGFALVKEAREKQQMMTQLAAANKLNLGDVLAGIDKGTTKEQKDAVKTILGLKTDINVARGLMIRRLDRTDAFAPMPGKEQEEMARYQENIRRPDDDKSKKLIGDILGTGAAVGEADQADIVKELGKGEVGDDRRLALGKMFEASKELKAMAGRAHLSVSQLKEAAGKGGKILGVDADKVGELIKSAGALGEGEGVDAVKDAVDQIKKRSVAQAEVASKEAATGEGGKMAMSGTVTINLKDGTMNMEGANVDMGSTPAWG